MDRKLNFNLRDVFYAGRVAFSGKKIGVHFLGIALMYIIYEVLVYLSLLIVGGGAVGDFWAKYGLTPACPLFASGEVPLFTLIVMWIGLVIAFVIFFIHSTMVSKITIQQLRGDEFYSMGDARGFVKGHWKAILGPVIGLIAIFVFMAIWPIAAALLGMIPTWVGDIFLLLASIILIPGIFLGISMVYLGVIFVVNLFFTPSITGTLGEDTFETIYQTFSIVWNQPWRILFYEILLFIVKIICVPIFAAFSILGLGTILLPFRLFTKTELEAVLSTVNGWFGGFISESVSKLISLPVLSTITEPVKPIVKQTLMYDATTPGSPGTILIIASLFTLIAVLFIGFMIISYLFSIMSSGNTIIYTVLRYKIDEENLLEVEEEEEEFLPSEEDKEATDEEQESEELTDTGSEE